MPKLPKLPKPQIHDWQQQTLPEFVENHLPMKFAAGLRQRVRVEGSAKECPTMSEIMAWERPRNQLLKYCGFGPVALLALEKKLDELGSPLKPDALETPKSPFRSKTGFGGGTEPGQCVTKDNAHFLPPGSVVRLDEGGRLIHLHDRVWLYLSGCLHRYDHLENMLHYLPGELCHIP